MRSCYLHYFLRVFCSKRWSTEIFPCRREAMLLFFFNSVGGSRLYSANLYTDGIPLFFYPICEINACYCCMSNNRCNLQLKTSVRNEVSSLYPSDVSVFLPYKWWKHHPLLCHRRSNQITTTNQAAFSPFLTNRCVLGRTKMGPGERTVSLRRWGCVRPVMKKNRERIFSPSLRPPPPRHIPVCPKQRHKNPDSFHLTLSGLVDTTSPVAFCLFLSEKPRWRQLAEMVLLDVRGGTAGPTAAVRSRMGGEEPCVSLRSRFGPRPDYLNLGGTAATRWSINLTQKSSLSIKT